VVCKISSVVRGMFHKGQPVRGEDDLTETLVRSERGSTLKPPFPIPAPQILADTIVANRNRAQRPFLRLMHEFPTATINLRMASLERI
jgi:hypothetical protein